MEVEPGQAVVSSGPYRWIRHPSYAGLLVIIATSRAEEGHYRFEVEAAVPASVFGIKSCDATMSFVDVFVKGRFSVEATGSRGPAKAQASGMAPRGDVLDFKGNVELLAGRSRERD